MPRALLREAVKRKNHLRWLRSPDYSDDSWQTSHVKVDVAIVVFRRPDTTAQVIEAIARYQPDRLFVISDGPRSTRPEDNALVAETRGLFDEVSWECKVIKIYSQENLGLRLRIESGLDAVFEQSEFCVVLEDDCIPEPSFFSFCEALRGKNDLKPRVGVISGSNFARLEVPTSYFFSRSTFIWGWATWADTWRTYRSSTPVFEASKEVIQAVRRTYSGFWERLFNERLLVTFSKHDSWSIPLGVYFRLNGYLSVVPARNLVTNIGGSSGGGTHDFMAGWDATPSAGELSFPISNPDVVGVSERLEREMWRQRGRSLVAFLLWHPIKLSRRLLQEIRLRKK